MYLVWPKNDQKWPEMAKKGQKWPFFKNKDSSDNIALFRSQIASLSHLLSFKIIICSFRPLLTTVQGQQWSKMTRNGRFFEIKILMTILDFFDAKLHPYYICNHKK